MNPILKYVLTKGAKSKEGITQLLKSDNPIVINSVKHIKQTLEKMGVDVSKITNVKEVEKFLNIQNQFGKK